MCYFHEEETCPLFIDFFKIEELFSLGIAETADSVHIELVFRRGVVKTTLWLRDWMVLGLCIGNKCLFPLFIRFILFFIVYMKNINSYCISLQFLLANGYGTPTVKLTFFNPVEFLFVKLLWLEFGRLEKQM